MELRHLRYFVAAAEAENVSRAALRLHVSQPALSRQIQDLEEELGVRLFERGPKSVQLTGAGRIFLSEARAVIDRVEEAVKKVRATSGRAEEVHVGYAPSPTVRLLPPALRAFQAAAPKVKIKLHDLSTQEMLAGIREGKLQLAFLVQPNRAMLRGLKFEELARDKMCLAVPPGHRWARTRTLEVRQAAEEPLVVFSKSEYPEYHEYLETVFAAARVKPRIVEELESSASLIAAVESGTGVAMVPESFSCSSGQRLKLIPFLPSPQPLVIGAVWLQKALTVNAEHFLKCAKQSIENQTL